MNKYKKFWNFFKETQNVLYCIEGFPDYLSSGILDNIQDHLMDIDPYLTYEISDKTGVEKRNFIVTANGFKPSFRTLEKLVKSAPKNLIWNIIAFSQRNPLPFVVTFGTDLKLSTDDLFFEVINKNNIFLNIGIYFNSQEKIEEFEKKHIRHMFLNYLLGEIDFSSYIGSITENTGKKRDYLSAYEFLSIVDSLKNTIQ
mgnify:CR=1 FL=1